MSELYELPGHPDTATMSLEELEDAMSLLRDLAPSEGTHGDADSILLELVERWSRMNESGKQRLLIRGILVIYRAMDKWYA